MSQLEKMQKEVEKIRSEKSTMQRKVIDSEYRSRRNNLLIFGIEEEKAAENVEEKVFV